MNTSGTTTRHARAPTWRSVFPNAVSAARLVLAVVFPFLQPQWRLAMVLAGGFSDFIDGLLARALNARSRTGLYLDPAADKVFVLSVLLTLTIDDVIEPWQATLVLVRDVVVLCTAGWFIVRRRLDALAQMKPRLPGKLATAVFYLWFVALLAAGWREAAAILFGLSAILSIAAAADYLLLFLRAIQGDRAPQTPASTLRLARRGRRG